MNLRRGLFRLWLVGSALFVLAVAFVSYGEIKTEFDAEFDAVARKQEAILEWDAELADWVYQRYYSDMPREQFYKKITSPKDLTDPELSTQLKAIFPPVPTPANEWTSDQLLALKLYRMLVPAPSPWPSVGGVAAIALGIPLAVLALGASLLWALSGFAAPQKE